MVKIDLGRLCKRLNYQFTTQALLKQALTHCSKGSDNYERFEFLGDSILNFVIANQLFIQFPMHSEGRLSRLRAFLVKGDMLTEIAKELALGDFLFLGQGELKSGGFRRASILADALEGIFAAIYLDDGINAAREVILSLYSSKLKDLDLNDCCKDAKTQLQEYLQAQKYPLPEYSLIGIDGNEHEQLFLVTCNIEKMGKFTQGQGSTRRKAEQIAASLMLKKFKR